MTKIILCLFSSVLFSSITNAQNNSSGSIEGNIDGLIDQTLYLTRYKATGGRPDTISSTKSTNGRFKFSNIEVRGAEYFFLKMDASISKSSKTLFLDESTMVLVGSIDTWPNGITVSGSKSHQEYEKFRKTDTTFMNKSNKILNHLSVLDEWKRKVINEKKFSDTVKINKEIDETTKLLTDSKTERYSFWKSFIHLNPQSFYTPFLIIRFQSHLGLSGLRDEYAKLTKNAKESFWGVKLMEEINYNIRQENNKIGGTVSDFISNTPEGGKLSLYEVISKGKYTLIDFWASWCVPCISEFPNIKRAYDVYHPLGLNIVGVSNDNRREAWESAIIKNDLKWYNVSDLDGNQGALAKSFGIYKLPTNFLVDSTGRIVAMDIFEDELIKTLAKYLKEVN